MNTVYSCPEVCGRITFSVVLIEYEVFGTVWYPCLLSQRWPAVDSQAVTACSQTMCPGSDLENTVT